MPYIQFQFRRGTASEWTSANPTLAPGELGLETDTRKVKIGDGIKDWANLSYGIGGEDLQLITTAGNTTNRAITISNTTVSSNTVSGALVVTGGVGVGGNLNLGGNLVVSNKILPTSNGLIDIGSPTARFGTVYVSGNSIDLGGTELTANAGNLFVDGVQLANSINGNFSVSVTTPTIISSSAMLTVGNVATTLDEFNINAYTTAKYIVQAVNGSDYHSMEAFLVNDKINAYLTVYASVKNNVKLINLDADISSGNVRLRATGITANNSVKIFSTKI
jgi:hypothetical protein